jgi:CheY-like chemotaxis protein
MQRMVQQWNVRADVATSGESAIQLTAGAEANDDPYEMFLIDTEMPGMDGLTCVQMLQSRGYVPSRMVLMVTAANLNAASAQLKKQGILNYVLKPILESELRTVLQALKRGALNEKQITKQSARTSRGENGLRVLVAEDNLTNRRLISRLLEMQGHQVTLACDGVEALTALDKSDFDVVLMDIQMPNLDGFQTTAAIRKAELETAKRLPIIALTAHAVSGYKETCLEAGMDGYLSKPIQIAELNLALGQVRENAPVS